MCDTAACCDKTTLLSESCVRPLTSALFKHVQGSQGVAMSIEKAQCHLLRATHDRGHQRAWAGDQQPDGRRDSWSHSDRCGDKSGQQRR